MTVLAIDIGNSRSKFGFFLGKKLRSVRIFTHEQGAEMMDFVNHLPDLHHCILCDVRDYPDDLAAVLRTKAPLVIFDNQTPIPVKNLYQSPETLGKDRLAAACGAYGMFPGKNILVINAGTCITYDVVNNKGEYLGGAISPGIGIRLKGLHTFTGRLPLVVERDSFPLTGTTTEASILSGVYQGAIAEINGMTEAYCKDYPELQVILSGGYAPIFEKRLKSSIFANENIVLTGLIEILQFHV